MKTQSWYEAAKKSMIDLVECAERTALKKVENKGRGSKQGKNTKEGKTNRRKFS